MEILFWRKTVMKRLLSMLLVVVMVMSLAMTAVYAEETTDAEVELPFTDVGAKKWFAEAVKYVYANGLMNGKSDTTFAPNEVLTRAQFAKMLWSLAGEPATEANLDFADTKNNKWYSESLTWAVGAGIVNGYEEGGKKLFKPDKEIFRDELAKMIVTFLDYMEVEIVGEDIAESFPDKIQNWAKEYVEAVRLSGLMKGKDGGKFEPKATATRAEGATILMRMHPSLALTPTKVMEDMVDEFLTKALCGAHSQVEIYFNFGASVTAENMVNAFVTAMELDTTLYTLELTAGLDGFKEAYSGAGRGSSAPGDLSFKLTDIASGEAVEFDVHIYGTKFYDCGEDGEEIKFYTANPPFIPFMCPDDFSSIKEEQALAANMDALKNAGQIRIENTLKFDYAGIWNAINDIVAPDHAKFELVLKKAELDAILAQTPAVGIADITADLTVEIRALSKGAAVVTEVVPVTFKVGYEDLTPGVADITVDALELLPGTVKIDGQISDGEYTMVDTFLEELELRNIANTSATADTLLAVAKTAKLGFAWDQAKGLHVAAQWVDPNLSQTYTSDSDWTSNGHGDNMLWNGTSFQMTVQTDKAINSATPLYYALGRNTETGAHYAGTYPNQGGYGDILYNNPPQPEVDYIVTYGDDNLVTVEWTIPAAVLSEDGIFEADDTLYISAVMVGKNADGFYCVSWGNDGVFKANGTPGAPGSNMVINLKGTGVCDEILAPMQEAIDAFLDSTECVHGDYNFMFTYGGSMTVESTLNAVAQAVGSTDKYTVVLDGDTNTSGWQAARDSYGNCDWAAYGGGGVIKFLLVDNATGLKVPFEFKFVGSKHFSLIDYQANGLEDFHNVDWDNGGGNQGEGYTDGIGVGATPFYAPWWCNDNFGDLAITKYADEVFAKLDQYKSDDGYVEVYVSGLDKYTAQVGTSYGNVWYAINDILEYDFPQYYMVLTADSVHDFIVNGAEGTLKIKITSSSSYPAIGKGTFKEINFRFIDKTVMEMEEYIDEFLSKYLCGAHGQLLFTFSNSSTLTQYELCTLMAQNMGNPAKYYVTLAASAKNAGFTALKSSYEGAGNMSGASGTVSFLLWDYETRTSIPFDVNIVAGKSIETATWGHEETEPVQDGCGINKTPMFTPYCNDDISSITSAKEADEILAQLDAYVVDGVITIGVDDFANFKGGSMYYGIQSLLKYDNVKWDMTLMGTELLAVMNNGGEGDLTVGMYRGGAHPAYSKGSSKVYKFKFVQKDVETIVEDFLDKALCATHNTCDMCANFGSSWTEENVIAAFVDGMGINTETHTLELTAFTNNYGPGGYGRHTSGGEDLSFKLTEIATGAVAEFDVHCYVTKYYGPTEDYDGWMSNAHYPVSITFACPDDQSSLKTVPECQRILNGLSSRTRTGTMKIEYAASDDVHASIMEALNGMLVMYNSRHYELCYNIAEMDAALANGGTGNVTFRVINTVKGDAHKAEVVIPVKLAVK